MTTPDVRRAGNGSGKITRAAVLAAALEIIDRDGAGALSMRRLARALDRDPMILYRHAPGKAALLDGVAETVLARLHVDSADPGWAPDACLTGRLNFCAHSGSAPEETTRAGSTASSDQRAQAGGTQRAR